MDLPVVVSMNDHEYKYDEQTDISNYVCVILANAYSVWNKQIFP